MEEEVIKTLQISEKLGNLSRKATCLNNIGGIYYKLGNYSGALSYFQKSRSILEQLEQLPESASTLSSIGITYYK
ncbi:MAG: tetratricopeptide repeat protein [Promethearchaeota archaeon]|jgi:tetratricopeptide (TPR) repeat protein